MAEDAQPRPGALGRAISTLRVEAGMSRSELAEAAGISYSDLAEIEDGVADPSPASVGDIAEALGISREAMAAMGTDGSPATEPPAEEPSEPERPAARSGRGYVVPLMGGEWEAMPGRPGPGPAPRADHPAGGGRRDLLGDLMIALGSLSTEDLRRLLALARDLSSRR